MDSDDEYPGGFYSNPQNFFNTLPAHMRPQRILTPQEGRKQVEAKSKILFETWDRLHQVVLAHELTIRKRWSKVRLSLLVFILSQFDYHHSQRTAAKRKELLLEVEPSLPKSHAPEVDIIFSQGSQLKENRETFLLPYLNLEDLSWSNGVKC